VFSNSLASADWDETTIASGDPVVLGAGERLFVAPLTIDPISTTAFSGGAVAHVFAAHP
jgi:hypothetical protein